MAADVECRKIVVTFVFSAALRDVRRGTQASHQLLTRLTRLTHDPVKDGLLHGGRPAKLFQDHRSHSFVQSLQVVAISLAACLALSLLFSEKFLWLTFSSGPTVWILTSNHNSDPWGSMMCTSALWMGRTLPGQVGHLT